MDDYVRNMTEKLLSLKATLQPFPVVVGNSLEDFHSTYIYMDSFYYKVQNPVVAVDLCFKAYHCLHASYPAQSVAPWLFLQRAIYGIETPWDQKNANVTMLTKDYLNL